MKYIILLIFTLVMSSSYAQVTDFNDIDFSRADTIAKINQGFSLENLSLLAHTLTDKLPTKVEKLRAIYTWVCTNISGDSRQDNIVTRERKKIKKDSMGFLQWNEQYRKKAFKKLLNRKRTMCTGYAYLVRELCTLADIECEIINGYGRTAAANAEKLEMTNHSWNAVKLNDKWYLCDATWSSGYTYDNHFVNDYNDGYFLADPVLFAQNHYPVQKKWLLDATLINKEYIATPLVYNEAFRYKIITLSPQLMHVSVQKNSVVDFSFKSQKSLSNNAVALVKFSDTGIEPFKIYDMEQKNGVTSFKYSFKHKGSYDAHLKIDNDIVASFVITVSGD